MPAVVRVSKPSSRCWGWPRALALAQSSSHSADRSRAGDPALGLLPVLPGQVLADQLHAAQLQGRIEEKIEVMDVAGHGGPEAVAGMPRLFNCSRQPAPPGLSSRRLASAPPRWQSFHSQKRDSGAAAG